MKMSAIAAALLGAAIITAVIPAQADTALTPAQSKAVETLIHDYLLSHPQVIIDAVANAEAKMKEQDAADATKKIVANAAQLYGDPNSPVLGNPKGTVSLVEFFDYRCPYCKSVAPSVLALAGKYPQLRIVMKEYPILSPESAFAAKTALVAANHGKYAAFHRAMFASKGTFDKDAVLAAAKSAGLDAATVEAQTKDPSIAAEIDRNLKLAKTLGVDGTPTFIAGDSILPGAVDAASLQEIVTKLGAKPS